MDFHKNSSMIFIVFPLYIFHKKFQWLFTVLEIKLFSYHHDFFYKIGQGMFYSIYISCYNFYF